MAWTLFLAMLPALAGCAGSDETDAELEAAGLTPDGVAMNGSSLNGISLNGISLNGGLLNGKPLAGRALVGVALDGVQGVGATSTWLDGTVFRGVTGRGTSLGGADFVGAVFAGLLDNGAKIPLRIDAMSPSPEGPDVETYAVSFATQSGWKPLCPTASGAATAIPLMGRWSYDQGVAGGGAKIADPSAFTFACRGHAIAKCVELGYQPWKSVDVARPGGPVSVSLADYHQACTRLIRADYCGDGTSYTVDGTEIDLYDRLGIQKDTEAPWPFEAEWDAGGARCAARQRISGVVPSCWARLQQSACGTPSHFNSGTLIMNRDALP